MGVPGWMTDPEHDGEEPPRRPLPFTDAWTGIDFTVVAPTQEEATRGYLEQYDGLRSAPRRGWLLVCAVLGGWLALSVALLVLATGLPLSLRICLVVSALFAVVPLVWLRRSPTSLARFMAWLDGYVPDSR